MRLKLERAATLKDLLKNLGLDCSDEEAQQAGLAIMRFALAKEAHRRELKAPIREQGNVDSTS